MDLRDFCRFLICWRPRRSKPRRANGCVRLDYPELPGCTAEGFVVEDVLKELERRRIEMIVGLVEAGKQPPVPRKPLADVRPALDRSRSRIVGPRRRAAGKRDEQIPECSR